tara:strand:+ start:353 stop:502 length:150 start_codon:yes stop_codon:yes gene_type:complete
MEAVLVEAAVQAAEAAEEAAVAAGWVAGPARIQEGTVAAREAAATAPRR